MIEIGFAMIAWIIGFVVRLKIRVAVDLVEQVDQRLDLSLDGFPISCR